MLFLLIFEGRIIHTNNMSVILYEKFEKSLSLRASFMYIRTPVYRFLLHQNEQPLKQYPKLLLTSSTSFYKRPDFFIESRREQISPCTIWVEVDAQEKVPPFPVSISSESLLYESDKLFTLVDKAFSMEHENSTLVGELSLNKRLVLKTTLLPSALKIIRMRINLVNEIISTEQSYVVILMRMVELWEPRTRGKIFNDDDCDIIFKQQHLIYQAQAMFLQDLLRRNTGFASILADVFIDFSNCFKISRYYISNYSSILKILQSLSPKNERLLAEIAEENQIEPLSSDLISPVQRMPRYILFLRDLEKIYTFLSP